MSETSLDNTIRENAAGPKRASGDSGSVEQHSLSDQIAADKHLASKQARDVAVRQKQNAKSSSVHSDDPGEI